MPTGPKAFLGMPGISGLQTCAQTHLKKALCHTRPFGEACGKFRYQTRMTQCRHNLTLMYIIFHLYKMAALHGRWQKRLEKKLDGNYTRMLRAILNKSWRQHPTSHQLYHHLPPITKTIQVRRTRHAGHCWRSRDELIRHVLLWTPTHGRAKAGRPARTYIQQLCEDTGCCPEDIPRAMDDKEEWAREGQGYPCYQRDMMMMMISHATSATWWWWYIYISII